MKLFSRIFSMLVIAFTFSVLFCAPTFAEESLSISVDGVAETELDPNTFGTSSVDVYVTSTARDGYKLSVSDSDENNALVSNHGDSINPLAESVTESNFTINSWGVKVGDNFLPVPKLTDNVLELANTTKAATNEKHTVTFGMKVDGTVTSGAYSSEVVFTAVANPLVARKTTLQSGVTVNAAWKTLANNSSTIYTTTDNRITSVQKFTGDFTDALRSAAQDIATADSDWPVYTWFDNGTIYYYTEADEVFFNADSSYMFANMRGLTSIDFNFGVETDVDPDGDGFIASVKDPVFITTTATDMQRMFDNARSLVTLDVSKMDVSNVIDMSRMFSYAQSLTNLNTTSWNTGKVTDMSYMMYGAGSLKSVDVSHWDVSNVQTMTYMFNSASSLVSLDANNWNTGSVTAMDGMFGACTSLTTLNASNWDTSKVTNMAVMFYQDSALTTLDTSRWDVSKVVTMDSMFWGNNALTSLNTSNWNTGSLVYADSMFRGAGSLTTLDVSGWNTSKVIDMDSMFSSTSRLTSLDVSNWDTSSVTSMNDMFYNASRLTSLNVSNWNTSKVTSMIDMFSSASHLTSLDVSRWDTSSVTNMASMFLGASSLTSLNVSNWDTSSVTNMSQMFSSASHLTSLDVSRWDTSSVTNMNAMFRSASSLTSLNVSNWNTSKVTRMSDMFNGASSLTSLDVSNWDTSKTTHMNAMFYNALSLTSLDVSNWDTSSVTNMSQMFYNASSLTTIYASDKFDTNAVTRSDNMFTDASNLAGSNGTTYDANHVNKEYAHIDVVGNPGYFSEKIVVRKATLKAGSQVNAIWKSLAKGDVTRYDAADQAITSIQKFTGDFTDLIQSSAMDIAVDNSDYPVWSWFDNGTIYYYAEADEVFFNANSAYMFYKMHKLVSVGFNFGLETDVDPDGDGYIASVKDPVYITSSITSMSSMFGGTSSLTSLDVSNWDTSKVISMYDMFNGASSLTSLDVSNWDTSKVTNMGYMFYNTSSLTSLDVSNWDTSKVTNMSYMFAGASSLKTIYASDKFNTNAVTNSVYMFSVASRLVGGNGTTYNASHVDKGYARIDRPGTPGYFTEKQRAVRKATLKQGHDISYVWRFTLDADPTSIKRFTGTFTDALQNAAINIAISTSDYPVYTWNSGSTIYYYTEADEVYLNSDSAAMFGKLSNLRSIDFNFGLELDVDPDGDGYVGLMSEPVFITSNVTSMSNMFYYTGITTLDLSGMDTRNVTNMSAMFCGSSSLTTIYVSNLFNTNAVTDSGMMFADATNLIGGNGTTYNGDHIDKEYARIDTPSTPGYFTLKTN